MMPAKMLMPKQLNFEIVCASESCFDIRLPLTAINAMPKAVDYSKAKNIAISRINDWAIMDIGDVRISTQGNPIAQPPILSKAVDSENESAARKED